MRDLYAKFYFTLLLGLLPIAGIHATQYYTIAAGPWADPSIWSNNGQTPCNCVPPVSWNGDQIFVRHDLQVQNNLKQETGSSLTIFRGIKMALPSQILTIEDGVFQVNGILEVRRLDVDPLGTLNAAGIVRVLDNDYVNKGSTTVSGELWVVKPGEEIQNKSGANFTINAGADVIIIDGDFVNQSLLTLSPNTCNSINGGGDFVNKSSGLVLGVGAVYAGGEMDNDGYWDPNVTWCAVNGATGNVPLPSPTCNSTICGPLPVTLSHFEATNLENGEVRIDWASAMELNNQFYTLERSLDGEIFTYLATLNSEGNSDQTTEYQFIDQESGFGTVFYRLSQTDLNGSQTELGIVSGELQVGSIQFKTWPNPFNGPFSLMWEGDSDAENVGIRLTDLSGKLVFKQQFAQISAAEGMIIEPGNLQKGVYLLTISHNKGVERRKLIRN